MPLASVRRGRRFWQRFDGSLARWVVLLVSLGLQMPPTASDGIDCRNVSGYTHGPLPDTCTVQLTLNETDNEIINSLKAKYKDFPLRCRLRKYKLYDLNPQVVRGNHKPLRENHSSAFLHALSQCYRLCGC